MHGFCYNLQQKFGELNVIIAITIDINITSVF